MENPHIGSDFDDFLKEQGIREEVVAAAIKRASMALGVPLKIEFSPVILKGLPVIQCEQCSEYYLIKFSALPE